MYAQYFIVKSSQMTNYWGRSTNCGVFWVDNFDRYVFSFLSEQFEIWMNLFFFLKKSSRMKNKYHMNIFLLNTERERQDLNSYII